MKTIWLSAPTPKALYEHVVFQKSSRGNTPGPPPILSLNYFHQTLANKEQIKLAAKTGVRALHIFYVR